MNKKFLSTGKIAGSEKGALLLSVIVTIVIFAVLGAAILSITSTSIFTQIYSNHATKAYYMAESGYRYATMNIMTISIGGDDCLKCHSSHGTETIRYSAGYGRLPDDTIKVHGKLYNDKDLLDGGSFKVNLAPFWFKFRAESGDWNKTDKKLTVHAVASSNLVPEVLCDFPEAFTDGTITEGGGGGLYINDQYIKYTGIDATGFENGILIFEGVDPDDIALPENPENGVLIDVFPACLVKQNQILFKNGELLINNAAGELFAFSDTKSVIEINNKLITYEHVDVDNGKLTGLGDVDELDPVVAGLDVKAGDIVTLSKTLKITSTGRYPDADANADTAEKTLEYYRWVGKPLIVPIVYNTAKPDEDKLLAGGNFHWVSDNGGNDDARGHNVLGISGVDGNIINDAPGRTTSDLGMCFCCHRSIAMVIPPYTVVNGCKVCHFDPHPATIGDEYCFLGSHAGKVRGNMDKDGGYNGDWQYSKSRSDHNEYRGSGSDNFDTTTGYCTGCHGEFGVSQWDGSSWIRHPSDWVIKDDGEFADAFGADGSGTGTYDPDVPVARPAGFDWTGDPNSNVYLEKDMVMCLSCHVAHGSQYSDMLRWDMEDMTVGNTEASGKGCFKCHTEKDDLDVPTSGQRCDNCHTMHNSQNNQSMALDGSGPYKYLLRKDPDGLDPLIRPHK